MFLSKDVELAISLAEYITNHFIISFIFWKSASNLTCMFTVYYISSKIQMINYHKVVISITYTMVNTLRLGLFLS